MLVIWNLGSNQDRKIALRYLCLFICDNLFNLAYRFASHINTRLKPDQHTGLLMRSDLDNETGPETDVPFGKFILLRLIFL